MVRMVEPEDVSQISISAAVNAVVIEVRFVGGRVLSVPVSPSQAEQIGMLLLDRAGQAKADIRVPE